MAEPSMRVAFCAAGEIWGGVEQFITTFARYLQQSGAPLLVVVLTDGPLRRRLEQNGIAVALVAARGRYNPAKVLEMRRLLLTHRIAILHTHGYQAAVIGGLAAHMCRVKHVRTEHGRQEPWRGLTRVKMGANAWLERLASRWLTDAIVFVSRDIKRHSPVAGVQVIQQVIYNGIEPVPIPARPDGGVVGNNESSFNIGIIGRIAPVKGHVYLLQALERLQRLDQLRLVVLGTGPFEGEFRQLCAASGMAGRIEFLGFQNDVASELARLHCVVMPSLHEGLPYTLLEALYYRVPVVASAVGGLAEVLTDGATALLVPPADSARLAHAIERLYQDESLRNRLASQGRRLVLDRFVVEKMGQQYLRLYERVLAA